jgi:hypothetical protein
MKNPQDKTRSEAESLLEDFLDHFCAPLVGIVAYEERIGVRREIASHLDAMAQEYEWQGQGPAQAMRSALSKMGEPWAAGEAWLTEWNVGREAKYSSSRLARQSMLARLVRPFAFFGVATMVNLLVLQWYTPVKPGEVSANGSAIFLPLVVFLMMVSPVLAGICTGFRQSAHLSRSIICVLLLLAAHSFLTGLMMLPKISGLYFAAVQIAVWLPVGVITARLTAAGVRLYNRRSFLRIVERAK